MAHRGRLYPLHSTRVWNAEAFYPFWAPRKIDITLPTALGTYSTHLANLTFFHVGANHTLDGLRYQAVTTIVPMLTDVTVNLLMSWQNIALDRRLFDCWLDAHHYPLGLPPVFWEMARWRENQSDVSPLHAGEIQILSWHNAAEYAPLDDVSWINVPYP